MHVTLIGFKTSFCMEIFKNYMHCAKNINDLSRISLVYNLQKKTCSIRIAIIYWYICTLLKNRNMIQSQKIVFITYSAFKIEIKIFGQTCWFKFD